MERIKNLLKRLFDFLAYTLAGLAGCALAFFISLQFLTPVFSEQDSNKTALKSVDSKQKKGIMDTINAVGKDIKTATQILKDIMTDTFNEKKKSSPPAPKASKDTIPPPPPPEDLEGFEAARPEPFVPSDKGQEPEEGSGKAISVPEAGSGGNLPEEGDVPSESVPPVSPQEEPSKTIPPPTHEDSAGSVPEEEGALEPVPPASQRESQQGGSSLSGSLLQLRSYMEPFIYDPSSRRRNPFEDITQKRGTGRVIKTPLEQYPLKDIRLKGIIWGVKSPKALFQLPDQQGFYTLLQGERVGKYGVIQEIREDEVEIQETIVKGDGQEQQTETRKTIKRIDRLKY